MYLNFAEGNLAVIHCIITNASTLMVPPLNDVALFRIIYKHKRKLQVPSTSIIVVLRLIDKEESKLRFVVRFFRVFTKQHRSRPLGGKSFFLMRASACGGSCVSL